MLYNSSMQLQSMIYEKALSWSAIYGQFQRFTQQLVLLLLLLSSDEFRIDIRSDQLPFYACSKSFNFLSSSLTLLSNLKILSFFLVSITASLSEASYNFEYSICNWEIDFCFSCTYDYKNWILFRYDSITGVYVISSYEMLYPFKSFSILIYRMSLALRDSYSAIYNSLDFLVYCLVSMINDSHFFYRMVFLVFSLEISSL